ncbi:hypothetical protein BDZ94DRAFT_1169030 [Collybia nuda]|uniref:Elongator complex protein 5 n=1 Tax=Collybia nuda TaxID=64659 RepID=A0A9P5Y057_9AGAR|nr:hypothetical protein BDZ94DRAFT_1169030 [Collybia nuda]
MPLLSTVIDEPPCIDQPILILQSSNSQSSLPLLRQLLSRNLALNDNPISRTHTLLFCLLYHPSTLLEKNAVSSNCLKVYDWVAPVPGYDYGWSDPRNNILTALQDAPSGSINVIIDSVDTILSDVGSLPKTYQFLRDLLSFIRARQSPSRLILHVLQSSRLLPLLIQTTFAPSLIHISAHHPSLLVHLAKDYLTLPPPLSHNAKFWGIFLPVSERSHDTDRLVFRTDGEGSGNAIEMILDIVMRGSDATGRKRGVERILEGWSFLRNCACDPVTLESLKNFRSKRLIEEVDSIALFSFIGADYSTQKATDPTQNISFNLTLTPSQQQSRAQVPLPYAHEGKPLGKQTTHAAIYYDPDSADDIDDDDPDEDLDI